MDMHLRLTVQATVKKDVVIEDVDEAKKMPVNWIQCMIANERQSLVHEACEPIRRCSDNYNSGGAQITHVEIIPEKESKAK